MKGASRLIIVVGGRSLSTFAGAAAASHLRELIRSVAAETREIECDRPRALTAQPCLEGVVVKLHAAAIPRIAKVTSRVHQPTVGDVSVVDEPVGKIVPNP